MKKYLVEFIGTFFLVITVLLTMNGSLSDLSAVAVGLVLMGLVYGGYHVSGAHYNPAVTIAVWIRGRITIKDVPVYIIVQFLAAFLAARLTSYLLSNQSEFVEISSLEAFDSIYGMLSEFFGTFALVWVILNVAASKATEGNSFYGLAIGATVTGCSYVFGTQTGGAFNPAVATGFCFLEMTSWTNLGFYFLGQVVAAILAALTFMFTNNINLKASN